MAVAGERRARRRPMAEALSRARPRAEPRAGTRAGPRGQRDPGSACRSSTTARRPVSAFLKLRDDGPCFLLESAEQGRLGRYSFLGFSPRAMLRWHDGVLSEWPGDASAGDEPRAPPRCPRSVRGRQRVPGPLPAGAGRRPAAVRGRGGRVLRLRPGPHGRAARRAEPRPDRASRHGADGQRRAGRLRPHAPRADPDGLRVPGRRGRTWTPPTRGLRARSPSVRERLRGPVPRPAASAAAGEPADVHLEHEPRAVRGERAADHRVHPRGRRLPGGPVAALLGAIAGRAVLDLPRPAHDQPLAVHVLPRLRRLPARRRLARAAGQGHRAPGRDAADRRHLPARGERGGGSPPGRRAACGTRRSAPST